MLTLFVLINFQLYTKKVPLDPNVDLRTIAASCNGYVGADLEALCREATIFTVKRSSDANEDASVLCLTIEIHSWAQHNKRCYCGNPKGDLGRYWRTKRFEGL